MTLDLNGQTISASQQTALFNVNGKKLTLTGNGTINNGKWIANIVNGGQVTIENGTYVTNKEGFTLDGEGSKLVMNGGVIRTQETGIVPHRGAIVEMNGGLIETVDNFGIASNGSAGQGGNTVTINGGKIDAHITSSGWEACAIYVANNDTFVINDGEIISTNGCGICQRAGNLAIHGGTIIATGEAGTTGKVGDAKFQMGKSAVIYHESANYPGKAGMKLTIDGGTFTGVDHAVEVLSNEAEPQVFVTGGTFTPAYPEVAPNEENNQG